MTRISRAEMLGVSGSLLIFLLFGSAWIHLPGPQQDELAYVSTLLPWLRPGAPFSLRFHGQYFPMMVASYAGTLKGWLLALWFLVIPKGIPGYRAFGIVLGVTTVWLAFWFVRQYYGRPIASLATALLATDPSFIHSIRLDWGPVALMHFFKMSGLCLLCRWLSSGSQRLLAAGMFLFGLGLWDKATFVWLLAGLGATVAVLFPREALRQVRAHPAAPLVAAAALLLGASPLLYYNLQRKGETWRERGHLELRLFKLEETKSTLQACIMSEPT